MHICECWTDTWRELLNRKSSTYVSVWGNTELSLLSECLNTDKQTNEQRDSSPGGLESCCSDSVDTQCSEVDRSDQLVASSSCSCSELPYLIHNLQNSNQIQRRLVLWLPLVPAQREESPKVLFPVSYLLSLLCFQACSHILFTEFKIISQHHEGREISCTWCNSVILKSDEKRFVSFKFSF